VIEQITKHLNKLIEVVKVVDLTESAYIERELMLIKVRAPARSARDQAHGRHLPRPHHRRDRQAFTPSS
jgi:acetolactate synthase small subunit